MGGEAKFSKEKNACKQVHAHFGMAHNHKKSSNLQLAIGLNLGFSIAEFFFGTLFSSAAISADAVHDLGDAILLTITLILNKLSKKKPTSVMSYGYKRFAALGALLNAGVILWLSYTMAISVYYEFTFPHVHPYVNVPGLMIVSIAGILVNLFAAARLYGSKNILDRTVSLHLIEDLLGWILTFITSVLISFSGLHILDRVASLCILLFISWGAISNAWGVLKILTQRAPSIKNLNKIKKQILAIEGVLKIENIHFWSLDGAEHVFSARIFVNDFSKSVRIRKEISNFLPEFQIVDSTIEILEK
ncbi:MAG: cation transporter [Candidatus Saccharimonas sp.]|nr:MAG: cation transporter [Candidatus Saccharimonas sp.]